MTEIVNLISSMGFPIVMCLLMYKFITDDSQQTREAINSLELAIKSVQMAIDGLSEFIGKERVKNED